MSVTLSARRLLLALAFTASLGATVPVQAQGDGPLSACLEQAGREAAAFEACLREHQAELEELYGLSAGWLDRLLGYVQAHPEGWDHFEDLADQLENRRDQAENARDRREDWLDKREDRNDDQVNLEDWFDRREDVRDRAEDRLDRREGVRDRVENRWDRRH